MRLGDPATSSFVASTQSRFGRGVGLPGLLICLVAAAVRSAWLNQASVSMPSRGGAPYNVLLRSRPAGGLAARAILLESLKT
jgi:hypothetical protein